MKINSIKLTPVMLVAMLAIGSSHGAGHNQSVNKTKTFYITFTSPSCNAKYKCSTNIKDFGCNAQFVTMIGNEWANSTATASKGTSSEGCSIKWHATEHHCTSDTVHYDHAQCTGDNNLCQERWARIMGAVVSAQSCTGFSFDGVIGTTPGPGPTGPIPGPGPTGPIIGPFKND